MFDCFLCGYLILLYCQSVRLSSFYPPARTDGECSSHSKHLQPDMLLYVPSKTTEVTHLDLWGSVTLAPKKTQLE